MAGARRREHGYMEDDHTTGDTFANVSASYGSYLLSVWGKYRMSHLWVWPRRNPMLLYFCIWRKVGK